MGKGGAGRRELGDWIRSVGVGVVFTHADIQAAFPGVGQIDRRVRDLRGSGWSIVTNRQDKNLRPGQLRCDQFGVDHRTPGPTDSVRLAVIVRDHRQCQVCGIIAGLPYPGEPDSTANIVAAHRAGVRGHGAGRVPDHPVRLGRAEAPLPPYPLETGGNSSAA